MSVYECENCGKKKELKKKGAKVPECCGKTMRGTSTSEKVDHLSR